MPANVSAGSMWQKDVGEHEQAAERGRDPSHRPGIAVREELSTAVRANMSPTRTDGCDRGRVELHDYPRHGDPRAPCHDPEPPVAGYRAQACRARGRRTSV